MGKLGGGTPVSKRIYQWKDNIQMDFRDIGLSGINWTYLISLSLSLFLSVFCAACQCFKTLFSVFRQGNNEEQAHTRNKGTNEHDWKETAIFLETSINT
jgi:hypothetical protein